MNFDYELFDILKEKPSLKLIARKIEKHNPKLLIEFYQK